MGRIVKKTTVNEFHEIEQIRALHENERDYYIYAHDKNHVDESWFPVYQEYINKIFNNDALDFVYMTCVKGYKENELFSFEVTLNNDYLKALHLFTNNLMPYKGKLLREWTEEAKTNPETKQLLRNFWKYELYFQCFFKEEE